MHAGASQSGFLGGARNPKVDEVGEVGFGDQDVGRLDIAVDQPNLVGGMQRRSDLLNDPDCAGWWQRAVID